MKTVIAVLMTLALMFVFSQQASAKTVYLKNGDEIDCLKVWKEGGRINVLINRDTLVDFAPGEVDLNKTIGHRPVKKKVKHHYKKRHAAARTAPKPEAKSPADAKAAAPKQVVNAPPATAKPAAPQPPSKNGTQKK